jgi:arsenate reductase
MTSSVTIFHNPACGTSRATLALLNEHGAQPTVVEYLQTGWTKDQLKDLLARMGVDARAILRTKGDLAERLGLTDPAVGDEALIEAMVAHPILVERPIVTTPRGAALCRPSELCLPLIKE